MHYPLLLILWLLSDVALFVAAYALAYFLRVGFIFSSAFPFDRFLAIAALTAPAWLLVLITTRIFGLTRNQTTVRSFAYISYSCLVGVALFTLLYYFQFTVFFSRLLLVYAFCLSVGIIWLWHSLFEHIMRSILHSRREFPTMIVGITRESTNLIAQLNARKNPLTPVAIVDGRGSKETEIDGVPGVGKLNKIEEVIESHRITHLIQCADLEQSLNLLSICREKNLTYLLLPSVLGIVQRDERIDSLEGHPVTVVGPARGWFRWFFR